jgi:hypothetical protein
MRDAVTGEQVEASDRMVVLPEPIDPVMTSTLTAPLFMREFRRILRDELCRSHRFCLAQPVIFALTLAF